MFIYPTDIGEHYALTLALVAVSSAALLPGYVADGKYYSDISGQYIHDYTGAYVHDNSGAYIDDGLGRYSGDGSGRYSHQGGTGDTGRYQPTNIVGYHLPKPTNQLIIERPLNTYLPVPAPQPIPPVVVIPKPPPPPPPAPKVIGGTHKWSLDNQGAHSVEHPYYQLRVNLYNQ